jgi:hypothetical protein
MKSRKSIAKFLALLLLSMGFFVLADQDVNAQPPSQSCGFDYDLCNSYIIDQCDGITDFDEWQQCTQRNYASCDAALDACYASNAWQGWLIQYNGNISSDPYMIDWGPDPICSIFPDALLSCGNLPTAVEIQACTLMIHQEQARFRCP